MPDAESSPPPDPNLLEELVAEGLEIVERDGPAAFEAFLGLHPAGSSRIRSAVARIAASGLVAPAAAPPIPTIDGYELEAPIGSGGMGVVYLARQTGLDRRVAIKLIRDDQLLHTDGRTRLLREVQAVARLDHEGIVRVHEVGEAEGRPFYSMEWVDGRSLGEVLDAVRNRDPRELRGADVHRALSGAGTAESPLPLLFRGSWFQVCLRIAQRVAEALEHAHENGIVHRDVKPSNIMLTAQGRVVLLDFGLAKVLGSERITRTEAQVGSLAYMSPEQIQGDEIDGRTDVYSLGVTLYEALTLTAPFGGRSLGEVQWAILNGVPRNPRTVLPSLAIDAETVCLTAMNRDRERRYASGHALAQDLDAVLELQPIRARRPGVVSRIHRLVRRHRAIGFAATLLVLAGVGTLLLWEQLQRADERADEAESVAERSIGELEAFADTMRERIRDPELRRLPGSSAVRERLMRDVIERFESLRALQPDDARLLRRGMKMHLEFAYAFGDLGRDQDAIAACEACIGIGERLRDMGEEWTRPDMATIASARVWTVTTLEGQGLDKDAAASGAECLAWIKALPANRITSSDLLHQHFTLATTLGQIANRAGQREARDRYHENAIALLAAAEPTPSNLSMTGHLHLERGNALWGDRDNSAALAAFERAVALHERSVAAEPQTEMFRLRRAGTYRSLGSLVQAQGDRARGRELLEDACEDFRALVELDPDDIGYASSLGGCLNNLAQNHMATGGGESAITLLEEAIGHQRRAHRGNPENGTYRRFLTNHLAVLVTACCSEGNHEGLDDAVAEIATLLPKGEGPMMAVYCLAVRAQACEPGTPADDAALVKYSAEAGRRLEQAANAGLRDHWVLQNRAFTGLREHAPVAEALRRFDD